MRPQPHRERIAWRAPALVAALACVSLCGWLALHHPLSPPIAVMLCLAAIAGTVWRPWSAMGALPALLPVLGLMPWTGWLSVEEFDLAVLAVAAGGYGRLALGTSFASQEPGVEAVAHRATALKTLMFVLWGASVCLALWRGVADAGGLEWGWWQGHHGPMNSVRLAKSGLLLMCLLPLWMTASRTAPGRLFDAWAKGASAGLALVGLLVVWERVANVGLLDFSSDYRVSALFWEMHVGGAALDGYLMLVLPFAVHALFHSHGRWRWMLAVVGLSLGGYACLVTFSRSVYLALPAGLLTLGFLATMQRPVARAPGRQARWPAWAWGAGLCVATAAAMLWVFPTGGYFGMLVLAATVALLPPWVPRWRTLSRTSWAGGIVGGALLVALLATALSGWSLGADGAWAVAWSLSVVFRVWRRTGGTWRGSLNTLGWTCFVAAALLTPWVAGGAAAVTAVPEALPLAVVLIGLALLAGRLPDHAWPESARWQGGLVAVLTFVLLATGVLQSGGLMEGRLASVDRDFVSRWQHWERSLSWLNQTEDLVLGRGAGRYPASRFFSGSEGDQVGNWTWREDGGVLALSAGKHEQSWGRIFRFSQRIGAYSGGLTLRGRARSDGPAVLHVDVCQKHLLYDSGACTVFKQALKGTPGQWQEIELTDRRAAADHGAWYAPKFVVFSVAVASPGRVIEIDRLSARDGSGKELIRNGDFHEGTARWYFTVDRHHEAWHAENLLLHVWFEQGLIGVLILGILVSAALWRLALGRARAHPLAPAVAASIVGVLSVGLFDSQMDVPRLAFMFQWLWLMALTLPARAPDPATGSLPSKPT